MQKQEYLTKISEAKIDDAKFATIQKNYGINLPENVKRIISVGDEAIFLKSGYRTLSIDEIANAKNELHVDFKDKCVIPVIDCGENDFIVYNFKSGEWSKFNIIDEAIFKKSDSFETLLK